MVGGTPAGLSPVPAFPDSQAISASMTSLSRPAQDSRALRPVRWQTHHSRALTPRLRHSPSFHNSTCRAARSKYRSSMTNDAKRPCHRCPRQADAKKQLPICGVYLTNIGGCP
jgi:hypothetical protein